MNDDLFEPLVKKIYKHSTLDITDCEKLAEACVDIVRDYEFSDEEQGK